LNVNEILGYQYLSAASLGHWWTLPCNMQRYRGNFALPFNWASTTARFFYIHFAQWH
jgi:hypothetical protein